MKKCSLSLNETENSAARKATKTNNLKNEWLIKDENGMIIEIKDIFQSGIDKETIKSLETKMYDVDSDIVFKPVTETFIDTPLNISTYETLCQLAISVDDYEPYNAEQRSYLLLWLESYSYLYSFIKESEHELTSSTIAVTFVEKFQKVEKVIKYHSLLRILNGIINCKSK